MASRAPLLVPTLLLLPLFTGLSFQQIAGISVQGVDDFGNPIVLSDDRKPSLYTNYFGDCLGSSGINVTRFDAAYYKDNMTVLFHLKGNTQVKNESLMLHIGVYAYGESRFDLTFDPCKANIDSLCPMNRSVPIEANGVIPIAPIDVAGIPPIALVIPDFEGQAILRVFANSTRKEIGCYTAVVTNGASFSHPSAVGGILGFFTTVAILASFATAIAGNHVPTMRTHYAHSCSALAVFSVFQHIYFTGALSLNWPSVLVAFWGNFAWSGGIIYNEQMQNSLNRFTGVYKTNMSSSSSSGQSGISSKDSLLRTIYGRDERGFEAHNVWELGRWGQPWDINKRALNAGTASNSTMHSSPWYGRRVQAGLPLPGNFSSFAGTLAQQSIPVSNAFLTGVIWLVVAVVTVTGSLVILKCAIEVAVNFGIVRRTRLRVFRTNWQRYVRNSFLRICLIAFFAMICLTTYQFSATNRAGPNAFAAIVFISFLASSCGLIAWAFLYRLRSGHYQRKPDRLGLSVRRMFKFVPYPTIEWQSSINEKSNSDILRISIPWYNIQYLSHDPRQSSIHEDESYISRFGWLVARYRQSQWWFFAFWIPYEFVRGCIYGGGSHHPMAQIVCLLTTEIIALIVFYRVRPLEGNRLNVLLIYLLGFSKISTLVLSAPFHERFNLGRIIATVLGIIIIVIQGILAISLLIIIAIGAVSSYMSVTRKRQEFKPAKLKTIRESYLRHVEEAARDLPPPPPPPPPAPVVPGFNVASVRRYPKIEEEDPILSPEYGYSSYFNASKIAFHPGNDTGSRKHSVGSAGAQSTNSVAQWGTKFQRVSWNSRDFSFSNATERPEYERYRYSVTSMTPLTGPTGLESSGASISPTETPIESSPTSYPVGRAS